MLAVRKPGWASCLTTVAMSRPDTGLRTNEALIRRGARIASVPVMADVDTWGDARAVASLNPNSRFAVEVGRTADHGKRGYRI